MRVGNEGASGGLSRPYVRLDTTALKGATVSQATSRIGNTGPASGAAKPVELWSTGAVSARTTGKAQPARRAGSVTVG